MSKQTDLAALRSISSDRPTAGALAAFATLAMVASCWAPSLQAAEFRSSEEGASCTIDAGETHVGDLYAFAPAVDTLGTVDGDLLAFAQNITVNGDVAGDVFAFGRTVSIKGNAGDSVRVFAESLEVQGEIDGDLLVFAARLDLGPQAHVTGDLIVNGNRLVVDGRVDGNLKANGANLTLNGAVGNDLSVTAGEVSLAGSVGRNVRVRCDTLNVDPAARVAGDLEYTARKRLDLEKTGIVAGEIRFEEKKTESEQDEPNRWFSPWKLAFSTWSFLSSLVLGYALIALFRKVVPAVVGAVESDTLPGLGLGFVMFVVGPVGAVILALLVITIPVAILAALLWLILFGVAKLPIALWLGQRILRLLGLSDPSPYLGLPIGLILIFVAFALPYLGWLLWWGTYFLGFGVLALGIRSYLRGAPSPAEA